VRPADRTHAAHGWFPDGLPDELLDVDERTLLRALGRPSLVRVPGTGTQPPRGIATLLHGDESTGFQAVHRILRRRRSYPFDLYVVIGNVEAALAPPGFAHRFLDHQEDMNRIWGTSDHSTPDREAAEGILARLIAAEPESLVDVHNNTGDNPFYAIVTQDRPEVFNLATLFTTTLLRWDLLANTLMEALHGTCPTIAVECGLPGRPESLAFAVDGMRRYLGAPPLRTDALARDFDLLGDLRKVTVLPETRFQFGGEPGPDLDLVLSANGDVHNFDEVPAGHVLGHVRPGTPMPVRVHASNGHDVTGKHVAVVEDQLMLTEPSTPVMMTRTVAAARKDCLFYLATDLPPPVL
jgi:hypothetical protein